MDMLYIRHVCHWCSSTRCKRQIAFSCAAFALNRRDHGRLHGQDQAAQAACRRQRRYRQYTGFRNISTFFQGGTISKLTVIGSRARKCYAFKSYSVSICGYCDPDGLVAWSASRPACFISFGARTYRKSPNLVDTDYPRSRDWIEMRQSHLDR